ncbi:MAG: hypothetical protein HKO57_08510, partial [Akkermansiaceae bacterium]|nr:hypothetical protein [Akkermansiaceae bacterium]
AGDWQDSTALSFSFTIDAGDFADTTGEPISLWLDHSGAVRSIYVDNVHLSVTTGADTTPPAWAASYPQVDSVTAIGATARARIDEDGTAYFVVVPDGATAPSAAEVKAGTASGGGAAVDSGSIALTANTENTGAITGLSASTAYDVYLIAEDGVPNLQATPVKIDIENIPPAWAATYPQVDSVTATGATARAEIDEDGTAYFVVVPDGASAPDAAEVKAGTASGGGAAVDSGSIVLTANTENTGAITGLADGTAYDVYFIAEDGVSNLQLSPVKVDITTLVSSQTTLVDEDWQTDPLLANGLQLINEAVNPFPGWTYSDNAVRARNSNNSADIPDDSTVTDSHGHNQTVELNGDNSVVEYDLSHNWGATDVYLLKVEICPSSWGGANQRYVRPSIRQVSDNTVLWSTAEDSSTAMPTLPIDGNNNYFGTLPDYPSELTFFFTIDASTFATGTEGEAIKLQIDSSGQRSVYINKVKLILDPDPDLTPPSPDPLTWEFLPTVSNFKDVSMRAGSAIDNRYGVEYFFENETRGTNSGWQDSREWAETDLDFGTTYTYRVKARDKSPNLNESTTWSTSESVTTDPEDLTSPSPDPLTWASLPAPGDFGILTMTVNPATDPSGVEYYFENVTKGTNSGWQDSTTWVDGVLDPETTYTYRAKARDKSLAQNESTTWSTQESGTTPAVPAGTLVITGFQSPTYNNNTTLGGGTGSFFPGWNFISAPKVINESNSSVPGDIDVTTSNQMIQFEWTDDYADYDIDRNWAADDIYTLTINASPSSWNGQNQRYIRPELKQQDGTVLWAAPEDASTAVPLYDNFGAGTFDDSTGLSFEFTIAAGDFASTVPGFPLTLRIGSSGQRGLYIDNVHLSVASDTGGGNDFADWIAGYPGVGAQDGLGDDPDGDGNDNGVENFFGTDPSLSTQGLVSGTADAGAGTFTFTHPQNATPADDLTAAYRWSTDLATFHADGASDGTNTVSFSAATDTPSPGVTTVTATVTAGPIPAFLGVDVEVTQN